jgi:uncharacterized membrane protein YfcA
MIEWIAYFLALIIGITLGLIGAGGSILTIPVLVYVLGISPVEATGYSLFIVGITAAAGSFPFYKNKLIDFRTALLFGLPSIIAVFSTRAFILPAIPEILIKTESLSLNKDTFLLLLFALVMIGASFSMIRNRATQKAELTQFKPKNYFFILIEGTVVGILTGLVGAGGGFLIIPALVLLSGMPFKKAIGTSLIIIAAKSLIGFLGEANLADANWSLLSLFSAFSIMGIFIGFRLSKIIQSNILKPAFGYFTLLMGIYILIKEGFLK